MECYNAALIEKRLMKLNDIYRYKIERLKRIEIIERYAEETGMRKITPDDFEVVVVPK